MTRVTKKFATINDAKKALRAIFGAGIYSKDGLFAWAKFMSGSIRPDGTIELMSTYWTEPSMHHAFEVGVDKI